MAENYTKDLKESVYHSAVVGILAVGYTVLGKTLTLIYMGYSDNLFYMGRAKKPSRSNFGI